jgi:hypothetical protein
MYGMRFLQLLKTILGGGERGNLGSPLDQTNRF